MRLWVIATEETDPYHNLALEETLMTRFEASEGELAAQDSLILYLWQNERTVVIGRHQVPDRECRLDRLREDGGHLARRRTGGGAVYHDLGNLNYSFLCRSGLLPEGTLMGVVRDAVRSLGLRAEISGRNDLESEGFKFSGQAWLEKNGVSLQHGTLMIAVDRSAMAAYLTPPPEKLARHAVDSVRSRTVNLRELSPTLTVRQCAVSLIGAAADLCGGEVCRVPDGSVTPGADLIDFYASEAWLYRAQQIYPQKKKGCF